MSVSQSSTGAAARDRLARRLPLRRPGRGLLVGAAVLAATVGVLVAVTNLFSGRDGTRGGAPDNGAPTSLATVTRRSLSSQTLVDGTLGYAGNYTVLNHATGTFTSLPAAGRIVRRGQVLYRVDGSPVILLYGSVPVYRALSKGERGDDVRQLNANLVALGYGTDVGLSSTSEKFDWRTRAAVKELQADLGVAETGTLALGSVVFLPTAARVKAVSATSGAAAGPGAPVLTATSTRHQVAIELDAALQSQVKVGDPVTITLPDGRTTAGRVSFVGSVASTPSDGGEADSESSPKIDVSVRLLRPAAAGRLDQAPVSVAITTAVVKRALVVPVNALLALAGGGHAVEVVSPAGVHRLVPVTTGLFDDGAGLVQVSGAGLRAGQRIVVPAS